MNRTYALLSASALSLFTVAAALTSGACSTDFCAYVQCVEGTGGAGGSTSSKMTTDTTTSASSMTTMSSLMPGCDLVDGMPVGTTCGAFVKAGATGGDGSQGSPFGSVGEATAMKPGANIYVCGTDTFSEAVILGDASLFGGLDCANWSFAAGNGRPTISGPADVIAVTSISGASRIIDSMIIESAPAVAEGGSSIALVASQGALVVRRSKVSSGAGATGRAGDSGGAQAAAAAPGKSGTNACGATNPTPPGAEIIQSCNGIAVASIGGSGGQGNIASGAPGSPGSFGGAGAGGAGETAVGWSCVTGNGLVGADGSPGMVGTSGVDRGTLDVTGFVGSLAGDGLPGINGQGGGGGGGAKGPVTCGAGAGPGASGGSGGAGGCGGLPGRGGAGGGSSFAIVAINVDLKFADGTTLSSAAGGIGGAGGDYQPGASGGIGATGGMGTGGAKNGCRGGDGGLGGNGGGGGGGRGGHSASIVYLGTAPNPLNANLGAAPPAAVGGVGKDNGAVGGNNGMAGASCKILDFATESCVM